jgi:AcrR family transcriptional regulator
MREQRDKLISKSLDYFMKHGVAGLSLRPLAEDIGTSARMVVYHFGSKDDLITTVMDEVRTRIQKSFSKVMMDTQKKSAAHIMRAFWTWMIHPSNVQYLRLLFEVQVLAIQNPERYARYMERTSSSWLDIIESCLPPSKERRVVATLCTAVTDGLLLEYLSTGDKRRTTKALEAFIWLIKNRVGTPESRGQQASK